MKTPMSQGLDELLATNLAAQELLERQRQHLISEEAELRTQIAARDAQELPEQPAAHGQESTEIPSQCDDAQGSLATAQQGMSCSSCGTIGKDKFTNAQRRRPACVRRCKQCIQLPTNESLPTQADSSASFVSDPRELALWSDHFKGTSEPALRADGTSAVLAAFEGTIDRNARNVIASHRELLGEMPAWIQWCVSATAVVGCFERHPPLCRFVLQLLPSDEAELWKAPTTLQPGSLVIDVLGLPCVASEVLATAAGHTPGSEPLPLLLVRYMQAPQNGSDLVVCRRAFDGTRPGRCGYLSAVMRAKGARDDPSLQWARTLRAQCEEEIDVAAGFLRTNEQALSAAFQADFYAGSKWHNQGGRGGFRCSFLVPPVPPTRPKTVHL